MLLIPSHLLFFSCLRDLKAYLASSFPYQVYMTSPLRKSMQKPTNHLKLQVLVGNTFLPSMWLQRPNGRNVHQYRCATDSELSTHVRICLIKMSNVDALMSSTCMTGVVPTLYHCDTRTLEA